MENYEEIIPAEESQPPIAALRREANIQGAALLIYHAILNTVVGVAMFAVAFIVSLGILAGGILGGVTGEAGSMEIANDEMMDAMMGASGWAYLVAVAIGLLILLLWKKPRYIRQTLLQKGKAMTLGSFFAVLSLVMAPQLLAQIIYLGLEELLQLFDMDPAIVQQLAGADTDSLGMLLYIGIAAPVSEELLFRGLLLRGIAPYNQKLAIFASALLFGLYHANPIQIPYAFLIGLVLAYVTLEYNVLWAIALHMFNNLVFALLLPMALSPLPVGIVDMIMWAAVIGFFVAAVLIVIAKWGKIRALWQAERVERWQRRAFYRAPTVVIMIILCIINTLAAVVMLLVQ